MTNKSFMGWSEGMQGMRVGGKRLLVIPPELGLDPTKVSGVPKDQAMVMEIELLAVLAQKTETQPEDLQELPSGLQYVDLKVGEGPTPEPNARLKVSYVGWLEDDTVIDAALAQAPRSWMLGRMPMKGLEEGVSTMRKGGKRKIIIPPELGYGEQGRRGIPPNATLTYEVEVMEIQEPPTTQPAARRPVTTRPAPSKRQVIRGPNQPPKKPKPKFDGDAVDGRPLKPLKVNPKKPPQPDDSAEKHKVPDGPAKPGKQEEGDK
jgi:peptidylprolyl isomerase